MAFNLEEYFCPMPGSEKEKDIVIFTRRHWISFLFDIIVSVFLLIVPIVIIIVLRVLLPNIFQGLFPNFLVIFGSVYYLIIATSIFNAWISYYYDLYILTNDMIIDVTQSGFFDRKVSQLSLLRVQDVSSKINGLFPTLFSFGDVLVETAGERVEQFLLYSVPNPQEFSSKVLELHDQLIEREGRHKQILEGEGALIPAKTPTSETLVTPMPVAPSPPENPMPTSPVSEPEASKEKKPNCFPEKESILEDSKNKETTEEGEIKKDDLDKGGEIDL